MQWGWDPQTFEAIATSLAVLLGSIGIFIAIRALRQAQEANERAYMQNRRARNVTAILSISSDMRKRWEGGWDSILREKAPRLNELDETERVEVQQQLTYMLNWLDWAAPGP